MKRRIAGLLTVCFCLLLLLSACSKRTAVKDDSSFIYCLNGDRTGLIKVNYEVKSNDPLQAAEAMLKELAKPSEDIDYTAPIPKGVKVNTCKKGNFCISISTGVIRIFRRLRKSW